MKYKLTIVLLLLSLAILPANYATAGPGLGAGDVVVTLAESDGPILSGLGLFYFFDLRDRETFVQYTYPDSFEVDSDGGPFISGDNSTAHIQIFNVADNCNENNFFDIYTPGDTHTYNMRDIQTNDGNPSGVVLPDGAYGFVVITGIRIVAADLSDAIGNVRILDNNGYEYRTNALALADADSGSVNGGNLLQIASSFNFNTEAGVILSDVVGITAVAIDAPDPVELEWVALPVQGVYSPFDIDIYDLNEVPFSCRDIIFSCVDEDNPLLEELLTVAGTANVASFEYGINNAIPHSKGGELLCPGNTISNGTVYLIPEPYSQAAVDIFNQFDTVVDVPLFFGFVGLNNGNERGSFDAIISFFFETAA